MSYSEKLAKRFAMGGVFCAEDVSTEHYDTLMNTEEGSPEEDELICEYNTWQHFEDLDNNDVIELLTTEKDVYQSQINQVLAATKRGLTILAMNDKLPSDMNDLNMDDVAMIGENTIRMLEIYGHAYTFDMAALQWTSETTDVTYEMGDLGQVSTK